MKTSDYSLIGSWVFCQKDQFLTNLCFDDLIHPYLLRSLEMAMHPPELSTEEKDTDKKPSSTKVMEEAVDYLETLLTGKIQELLRSSAQAKLTPREAISAALKIQDLALSMCAQVDEVMLKMATESADFSPSILSAEVLNMDLEHIPEFRIIFSGKKKALRAQGFDAKRIHDLMQISEGELIMDVAKVWMLGDKRLIQIVELYLRKSLPIGRVLMPEDQALLERIKRK